MKRLLMWLNFTPTPLWMSLVCWLIRLNCKRESRARTWLPNLPHDHSPSKNPLTLLTNQPLAQTQDLPLHHFQTQDPSHKILPKNPVTERDAFDAKGLDTLPPNAPTRGLCLWPSIKLHVSTLMMNMVMLKESF